MCSFSSLGWTRWVNDLYVLWGPSLVWSFLMAARLQPPRSTQPCLTRFNSLVSSAGFQWEVLLFWGSFQWGGIIWYYASQLWVLLGKAKSVEWAFFKARSWWTVHQGMHKHDEMPVWLRSCMTDFLASEKMRWIKEVTARTCVNDMSIIMYLEKCIEFQNSSS